MTLKTFNTALGGSWETATDWTPNGVPGASDDALINLPGTYTVTLSGVESPNSITLSAANATLTIGSTAVVLTPLLTMNAGTLVVDGLIEGSTIVNNGGSFEPSGGTLEAVTWQGPLSSPTFSSINIVDGITLLNAAGTGPGTLDIAGLYMVNVLDSTPLSDMTINFDAFNNEYLTGSNTQSMIFDTTTTVNQSQAGAEAQIGGTKLINNGTMDAIAPTSNMFIQTTNFVNNGLLVAANGDHVTIQDGLTNIGSIAVSGTSKLTVSDTSPTALSNTGTISVTTSGSLGVSSTLGGNGVITLANLGVADLFNTSNTTTFLDAKGTLKLEAPGSFTGNIAGLVKGDKIDLLATPVTKLSYSGTTASGVLTVLNGATTVASLSLLGDYTQSTFGFTSDGLTGNNIAVAVSSMAPRTLSWTGGNGTTAFLAPANWNDISDTLNPALTAPIPVDTVLFDTINGGISASNTVAATKVGAPGDGVLEFNAASRLVTGSLVAGVLAADTGEIGISDTSTTLAVTGVATVGSAGVGEVSVLNGATFQAATLDEAAAAGADGAISISGTGSAMNVTGIATIGDQSSGSLNIVNGATATVGGLTIGSGSSGSGNVVIGPGSHLILTTTSINVGLAGSAVLDIQGGTLGLVSGTTLSPGTFGRIVQVGGLIDPATVFDASGGSFGGGGTAEASGTILNSSLASVSGGAETLLAPLITSSDPANIPGDWSIKNSGTLVLDVNSIDNSQTIQFGDLTGVLTIGQQVTLDATQTPQTIAASALSGFAAPIVGYKTGDKITFTDLSYASDTVSGNVVTLWSGPAGTGSNLGSLTFQTGKGAADKTGAAAAAAQLLPCFAAGTRIMTEDGPRAVEDLTIGDRVALANGGHEAVVWIARRTVNCAKHPKPETVWPVRIKAGAFGGDVPVRDLYLSPDHSVFVNGVLVPAKLLINGTSIASVERDRVTYFHVELPEHAVILAEELPVESYLDTGDKANFHDCGTAIRLIPDFAARLGPDAAMLWETRGAAPLVTTGVRLAAVRRRLKAMTRAADVRAG